MALLVPVAYAPDCVQWILEVAGFYNRNLSHSLISVAIGATIVALVYRLARGSNADAADAAALWLLYLSHWPADVITGMKPTWPGGPEIGFMLYRRPVIESALEIAIVLLCWRAYRDSLPPTARRRNLARLVPAGLIALQLGFAAVGGTKPRAVVATQAGAVNLPIGSVTVEPIVRGSSGRMAFAPHAHLSNPSERKMADDKGPIGILTLVCLTCGNEKFYDRAVPAAVTCEKCGGTVFRNFATPTEPDEASIAQLEDQARSISYGDSSPDTSPGDVEDLDMR